MGGSGARGEWIDAGKGSRVKATALIQARDGISLARGGGDGKERSERYLRAWIGGAPGGSGVRGAREPEAGAAE